MVVHVHSPFPPPSAPLAACSSNITPSQKVGQQQQGKQQQHGQQKQQQQQGKFRGGGKGSKNKDNRGKPSKKDDHGRGQCKRYCFVCGDPEHLSYQCPDCVGGDSGDEHEGPRERANAGQSRRENKHNDSPNHQPANNARGQQRANSAGGDNTNTSASATTTSNTNTNGTGQASCAMVGTIVCASPSTETPISLAPEAGEDFQAVAAAMHANPSVVLLNSDCSHYLIGDRNAFVGMQDGGDMSHVHRFNGGVQPVRFGHDRTDETVLLSMNGTVFARTRYTGWVLCTTLRPFVPRSSDPVETVALWAIVSSIRDSMDKWYARLAHVGIDTINKTAVHRVATGLEITSWSGADPLCVSCVRGKLVRHTFSQEGKESANVLGVVQVDVCGPFRVAAKDGSRYFLLKYRKTRFVWTYPLVQKSDALKRFRKWLPMVERQCNTKVKTLRSDRGGEFLGHEFTEFLDIYGIIHDLRSPYTPQRNGMAEREMHTVVESVRTMLLHMGV
ncbi:unnamed protein product [Closterium sp. NIES-53]